MRVLLVPPKGNYPDPRPCLDVIGQGAAYIAAALKAGGHEVRGVNTAYRWCDGPAETALDDALARAIADFQPQLIGVGGLSAEYRFVRDAIAACRRAAPDVPIVCGGGIMTYDPEFVFEALRPDFGLVGEAEQTVVALADALAAGWGIEAVGNLIRRAGGRTVANPVDHTGADLDELPLPDYEPFDVDAYLAADNQADNWVYAHTRRDPRCMPLSLARACPYRCTFCCHTLGPRYRCRSVGGALDEIRRLHERYRFNMLFISDELFSANRERVRAFCAGVRELPFEFHWTCACRVSDVDADLLTEMKRAGCAFILYGLESASPTVLDSMRKRTTVADIRRAIEASEQAGVGVQGNFIFGDPAETPASIAETEAFYRRHCADHMVNFSYVIPYPGSEIFRGSVRRGLIGDRRTFYEHLGRIGTKTVNMTSMPDEVFFGLTEPILRGEQAGYRRVAAVSAGRRGEEVADAGAPEALRRVRHELVVRCPHCGEDASYRYPLPAGLTDGCVEAPGVCPRCHRRFMMVVRLGEGASRPAARPVSAGAYATPLLVGTHGAFNLVAFCNRIYALRRDVGPLDLTCTAAERITSLIAEGRCVVADDVEEAGRRVDELGAAAPAGGPQAGRGGLRQRVGQLARRIAGRAKR
jgi:radical SAM superfamily enzyme YgiQ (UPF0313 family)